MSYTTTDMTSRGVLLNKMITPIFNGEENTKKHFTSWEHGETSSTPDNTEQPR